MYAYPTHQNIAVIHSTVSFIIGKKFYSICSGLSKGDTEREKDNKNNKVETCPKRCLWSMTFSPQDVATNGKK